MRSRLLFLTGFMGSGKTTVGRRLARSMGIPFIDIDAEIVRSTGRSINEIFAQDGEAFFRSLEQDELRRVCRKGDCTIVATGGGIVVNGENLKLMREAGLIVNLQVDFATIAERLAGDSTRPLLQNDATAIRTLMADREAAYRDADLLVDTTHKSTFEVVHEIMDWLQHDSH